MIFMHTIFRQLVNEKAVRIGLETRDRLTGAFGGTLRELGYRDFAGNGVMEGHVEHKRKTGAAGAFCAWN